MSKFPDDCIQSSIIPDQWWVTKKELNVGSLVWAAIPFFEKSAMTLLTEGRDDPKDHHSGKVSLKKLTIPYHEVKNQLPVAGLKLRDGEFLMSHRAKVRPALVLKIMPACRKDEPPCILLAPFFGVKQKDGRIGFPPEFIKEVKHGEYPQFIWDNLPISEENETSFLRFDRILSIRSEEGSYIRSTGWGLSEMALGLVNEWFMWFQKGTLQEGSLLLEIISCIQEYSHKSK